MRIAGLVVGCWIALLGLRTADACGYWSMTDKERGFQVGWLINAGSITKGAKQGKRVGALYLDLDNKSGIRVAQGKTVVFDIKDGKLRKYGKPIASVGGLADARGSVAFGSRTYTIDLADIPKVHDMPTWKLTVKRGDTVVLESDEASSLCAGMHRDPPMSDGEAREEVRRRVIFYLAWRETGM